jgi:hypothetical protein
MASLFHLDWPIDPDGYRISGSADGAVIVRNGGDLITQTPLEVPGLCRRLAACDTYADLCEFVGKYGFLTGPERDSEPLELLSSARAVAKGLTEAPDNMSIGAFLDAAPLLIPNGFGVVNVQFDEFDERMRPKLKFRPANLYQGIMLQFLEEVGQPMRHCKRPGCPEWFTYGPGTDHRETALYCSPKCQNAHTYDKRKQKLREARS